MVLSICIPSYNRGNLAYKRVMELLNMGYEEDVQICISNNGSVKDIDGYEKIKNMNIPRLKYHEFSSNHNYLGNFNQVVKMSDGDFCMVVSDEDSVVGDNLVYYLEFLKEVPEIGIMKGCSEYYPYNENTYCQKGMEAIKKFYMCGNYVSGIIFNRKLITNDIIDEYMARYGEINRAYYFYPHMMLEAYALINGDFGCSDYQLIHIDNSTSVEMNDEERKQSLITGYSYNTVEERIKQMFGFEQQICDIAASDAVKLQMFRMIIDKTIFLCMGQMENYISKGYDWGKIVDNIEEEISRMIDESKITVVKMQRDLLHEYVYEYMKECRSDIRN